jgi:hypothetical protein
MGAGGRARKEAQQTVFKIHPSWASDHHLYTYHVYTIFGITNGPNMRIRALNLFKKVEHLKAENNDSDIQSLETFF